MKGKGQISIGSTASPPRSARWNEEMDERSARRNRETGCQFGRSRSLPLVSLGCARIPILARSINAPYQRSDTLMQLSRSPAQRSTLRRTAGLYMFGTTQTITAVQQLRQLLMVQETRRARRFMRSLGLTLRPQPELCAGVQHWCCRVRLQTTSYAVRCNM